MKRIIQLEEAFMLSFSIAVLISFDATWWVYILILIGPDISMVGYVAGNKTGAVCYNLFHHKGIAIAIFLTGFFNHFYWLEITGLILFGHSSLDRMLGYGLKYSTGFQFTHLGQIGRTKSNTNNEIK